MKFIYITNVRMPTEKAHGVQMIKMCEAFALLGVDLSFVVPNRANGIKEDAFEYYGVKRIFKIKKIPVLDMIKFWPVGGYWLEFTSFIFCVVIRFSIISRREVIIYTREYVIAFVFRLLGFRTVYEAHRIIKRKNLFFYLTKKIKYIITNSEGTADAFIERGFKSILACPNGVDLDEFNLNASKWELMRQLNLPTDKKIVMYTGNLYDWKGTDTLIKAAGLFSNPDVFFIFIGGTDADIKDKVAMVSKIGIKNVVFFGHKNRKFIPSFLKSADCLVLPNSPISEESIKYTSPVKLAEYMASGVPIVSSDLPSLKAILSPKSAIFVPPDDPEALKRAITKVLDEPGFADNLIKNALSEVTKYTWDKRAKKIVEFIGLRG